MSALWSRVLELLGRIRLGGFSRHRLSVGSPDAPDARGGPEWKAYLSAERLYDVWGPMPGSPWVPFHCVPLFAAMDRLEKKEVGPTLLSASTLPVGGSPPAWVNAETWTVLDLPGPAAVEVGAWLITAAGCQPVCTFDNWPHPSGVLKSETTLAELLRWASTVASARSRLEVNSPPIWICDSQRLGVRSGGPGEFDNRYYLDDSILPGPALLSRAGIRRVVYVTAGMKDPPVLDVEAYFAELLSAGFAVLHVDLAAPDAEPQPLSALVTERPPRLGFRRSAAGGFGTDVPMPSSSGG